MLWSGVKGTKTLDFWAPFSCHWATFHQFMQITLMIRNSCEMMAKSTVLSANSILMGTREKITKKLVCDTLALCKKASWQFRFWGLLLWRWHTILCFRALAKWFAGHILRSFYCDSNKPFYSEYKQTFWLAYCELLGTIWKRLQEFYLQNIVY